ncbi:MAG: hypothetical protein D6798_00925 [Deltaproteobacteria bacterium]|nr:MAG: hypothetical protein D6798_00925 [Deltaproteobacteria bacterium]
MPPPNLPDEIVRILSFHGPVELWTGRGESAATARVELAPFDDELILAVPRGSRLEEGLLRTPRAMITAKAEDQHYSLRLVGRAVAGRSVSAHPRRAAITPWLSEGARPDRLLAVPFVAEEVELVKVEGAVRDRYAGPTPAGRRAPGRVGAWALAALGGAGKWAALAGAAATFVWFGYLGADYPLRPLALLLAWVGVVGLVGGIRLLGQAAAFLRWRTGRGSVDKAPALRDGWLAPREARRGGLVALAAWLLASLVLSSFPQGGVTVLIVVLATGAPVLAASWALHAWVAARQGEDG